MYVCWKCFGEHINKVMDRFNLLYLNLFALNKVLGESKYLKGDVLDSV